MADGRTTIVLDEYQSEDRSLPATAVRDLASLAGDRLAIGLGTQPGTWRLSATQHVGSVVTPEVAILVRPKIPLRNLFWMLDVDLESMAWAISRRDTSVARPSADSRQPTDYCEIDQY